MPGSEPYYDFIPSTAMKPVPFVDYEKQVQASFNLAADAADSNRAYRVLLFGYPRTGKTTYTAALAYTLNIRGYDYSLLKVYCQRLIRYFKHTWDIKNELTKIMQTHISPRFKPLIIALDELDAIAPVRTGRSERDILSVWTMAFLNEKISKTIIFGITNFPDNLDRAVLARMPMNLYFPLPDERTAIELLVLGGIQRDKAPRVYDYSFR